MQNSMDLLQKSVALLECRGIHVWVFGGWAEELRGAIPRHHKDIDLLYLAQDFSQIDRVIEEHAELDEISAKRTGHKRAFTFDGVMVELFLVKQVEGSLVTDFWDVVRYEWPPDSLPTATIDSLRVASTDALADYRQNHDRIRNHPPRST